MIAYIIGGLAGALLLLYIAVEILGAKYRIKPPHRKNTHIHVHVRQKPIKIKGESLYRKTQRKKEDEQRRRALMRDLRRHGGRW